MDKAVHDLYKETNDNQQKIVAPNDGSSTSVPTAIETTGQNLVGQIATKPVTQILKKKLTMDHAVVQNERQQTDIKTVADDAKTGATQANTQPPDTRTLAGTIANEANPNTNPR